MRSLPRLGSRSGSSANMAALAIAASAASALVYSLTEPRTQTRVVLVGTMHHNPASVALVRSTVLEERRSGRLRVLLVESCPTRWNTTLSLQPSGSLMHRWLADEMQHAADAAAEEPKGTAVELVLADQRIQQTGRRARILRDLTLAELTSLDGCRHIARDLRDGWRCLVDGGQGDRGVVAWSDVLDPQLLLGLPVAWARVVASALVRGSVAFRAAAAAAALLALLAAGGGPPCDVAAPPTDWRWCVATLDGAPETAGLLDATPVLDAACVLGTVILARVGAHPRAEGVGRATVAPAARPRRHGSVAAPQARHWPRRRLVIRADAPSACPHPTSPRGVPAGLTGLLEERNYVLARRIRRACERGWRAGEPPARTSVVAVLGLAHVNGVHALLRRRADVEMVGHLHDGRAAARRRAAPQGGQIAPDEG